MQNLYFATIFVLVELAALGLGWLAWLVIRRKWSEQRRRRVQEQDLKRLAWQLVQAHETLVKQLQACGGANPPSPAEVRLKEAIGQLRQLAVHLAGGQVSAFQVSQGLLSAQESILAAFETAAAHPLPVPVKPREAMAREEQSLGPADRVDFMASTERNENAPVSKSEDELQAEIDALLQADGFEEESPALDGSEKAAASHTDIAPAPLLPGKQIRGLDDDELQAEMDALLNPRHPEVVLDEPAPAPQERKPTEAEIEAEMQAELDALLSTPPREAAPASAATPVPEAGPEPKLSEAEIEAMMQADLEAMLSTSQPAAAPENVNEAMLQAEIDALLGGGPPSEADEPAAIPVPSSTTLTAPQPAASDLQAEIDALLSGEGSSEPDEPVAVPTPVMASALTPAASDLQAEIDALLSSGGNLEPAAEPAPPMPAPTFSTSSPSALPAEPKPAASDLQAEIDALLNGGAKALESAPFPNGDSSSAPPLSPAAKLSTADLQAEIDALLNAAANEPESEFHKRVEMEIEGRLQAREQQGAPAPVAVDGLAISQAEIDALLGGEGKDGPEPRNMPAPPASKPEPLDLQAEIDALFNSGGAPVPVAGADEPQPAVRNNPVTLDLQAEIDALFNGGGHGSASPAPARPPQPQNPASDLQAEIDALLAGASPAPSAVSASPRPVASDLQAEIDALLMGAASESGQL